MKNIKDYNESNPIEKYKYQLDVWYRTYNIHREKMELFYDFITSLNDLINETFLGYDVLYLETDQRNHFNWCWEKTISNFENEKIFLKERGLHYDYFWNFFFETFYLIESDTGRERIREYFYKLFDFGYIKTRSELDILTDIYIILEQNLKK